LASFIETKLDSIYQSTKGVKRDLRKLDELSKTFFKNKKDPEYINIKRTNLLQHLKEQ
jgi:hypothetical protein